MSLTLTDEEVIKLRTLLTDLVEKVWCPTCYIDWEAVDAHNEMCDWYYFKQLLDKHEGEE